MPTFTIGFLQYSGTFGMDGNNRQQPVMHWSDSRLRSRQPPRIPQLNSSKLPWLQTLSPQADQPYTTLAATSSGEMTGTTGRNQGRPPFSGARLAQSSPTASYLGSVADRTSPARPALHKKVTSQMGPTALRDPGKMLDMNERCACYGRLREPSETYFVRAKCFKGQMISNSID